MPGMALSKISRLSKQQRVSWRSPSGGLSPALRLGFYCTQDAFTNASLCSGLFPNFLRDGDRLRIPTHGVVRIAIGSSSPEGAGLAAVVCICQVRRGFSIDPAPAFCVLENPSDLLFHFSLLFVLVVLCSFSCSLSRLLVESSGKCVSMKNFGGLLPAVI